MTRTWRDNLDLMKLVGLVLVDEVHCIGEPRRGTSGYARRQAAACFPFSTYLALDVHFYFIDAGACLEVVVTRMKVRLGREDARVDDGATRLHIHPVGCWSRLPVCPHRRLLCTDNRIDSQVASAHHCRVSNGTKSAGPCPVALDAAAEGSGPQVSGCCLGFGCRCLASVGASPYVVNGFFFLPHRHKLRVDRGTHHVALGRSIALSPWSCMCSAFNPLAAHGTTTSLKSFCRGGSQRCCPSTTPRRGQFLSFA